MPPITTIDQFAWAKSPEAEETLRRLTSNAGVEHLLDVREDGIGFARVFDHYVADVPRGMIERCTARIGPGLPELPGEIVLLHLDAPKSAEEFIDMLIAYGPQLAVGSAIAFQDFFFHRSATLIAAVGWLLGGDALVPEDTAGSTLVCRLATRVTSESVDELKRATSGSDIIGLIDIAIANVEAVSTHNDPDRFMARLLLARAQYAFATGDYDSAAESVQTWRERYQVAPALLDDLAELMLLGFSSYGREGVPTHGQGDAQ